MVLLLSDPVPPPAGRPGLTRRTGGPVAESPTATRAALFVLIAAVLWGTTGTAQELGPADARPVVVGAARLGLGGLGLLAVSLVRRRPLTAVTADRTTLAVGAIAVAAYQLTFFGGVRLTGVAVGTVVGIGSAPVFGAAVDVLTTRRRPPASRLAATAVALVGAGLLVVGAGDDVEVDPVGVVLALAAGASYAVYAWAVRRLGRAHHPDDAVTVGLRRRCRAPVEPDPGHRRTRALRPPTGACLDARAHLGLLTVTVSYLFFGRGAVHLSVGTTTTVSLAEPATAALLALTVLDETPGAGRSGWAWPPSPSASSS